jgi:hypothetical protein
MPADFRRASIKHSKLRGIKPEKRITKNPGRSRRGMNDQSKEKLADEIREEHVL